MGWLALMLLPLAMLSPEGRRTMAPDGWLAFVATARETGTRFEFQDGAGSIPAEVVPAMTGDGLLVLRPKRRLDPESIYRVSKIAEGVSTPLASGILVVRSAPRPLRWRGRPVVSGYLREPVIAVELALHASAGAEFVLVRKLARGERKGSAIFTIREGSTIRVDSAYGGLSWEAGEKAELELSLIDSRGRLTRAPAKVAVAIPPGPRPPAPRGESLPEPTRPVQHCSRFLLLWPAAGAETRVELTESPRDLCWRDGFYWWWSGTVTSRLEEDASDGHRRMTRISTGASKHVAIRISERGDDAERLPEVVVRIGAPGGPITECEGVRGAAGDESDARVRKEGDPEMISLTWCRTLTPESLQNPY